MTPGRELDELIAEKVMGWKRDQGKGLIDWWYTPEGKTRYDFYSPDGAYYSGGIPFSQEIAAAWEVLEHLKSRRHLETTYSVQYCETHKKGPYLVIIQEYFRSNGRMFKSCSEYGETAAHAICLAALKAVGE